MFWDFNSLVSSDDFPSTLEFSRENSGDDRKSSPEKVRSQGIPFTSEFQDISITSVRSVSPAGDTEQHGKPISCLLRVLEF